MNVAFTWENECRGRDGDFVVHVDYEKCGICYGEVGPGKGKTIESSREVSVSIGSCFKWRLEEKGMDQYFGGYNI